MRLHFSDRKKEFFLRFLLKLLKDFPHNNCHQFILQQVSPTKAPSLLASSIFYISHPQKPSFTPRSPSSDYLFLFISKLLEKMWLHSLFFTASPFTCFWRHSSGAIFSTETAFANILPFSNPVVKTCSSFCVSTFNTIDHFLLLQTLQLLLRCSLLDLLSSLHFLILLYWYSLFPSHLILKTTGAQLLG